MVLERGVSGQWVGEVAVRWPHEVGGSHELGMRCIGPGMGLRVQLMMQRSE